MEKEKKYRICLEIDSAYTNARDMVNSFHRVSKITDELGEERFTADLRDMSDHILMKGFQVLHDFKQSLVLTSRGLWEYRYDKVLEPGFVDGEHWDDLFERVREGKRR